jgi:predicted MFS family arabinose efflux permease
MEPGVTGPLPAAPAPPPAAMPRAMLPALCAVTFVVTSSGIALSPFLLDMARELRTTLGSVANLVAVMNVTWGATSVTAGFTSDRIGRRPVLLAAVLTLGAARLGLGLAQSYAAAIAWQLLAGIGGGAFMGTVFAAVSDHVPPGQRGRALGWVMTGQSLSLVVGVPLITLVGALAGWRGAMGVHAGAAAATVLALLAAVPRRGAVAAAAGAPRGSVRAVLGARILALLGAATAERACFAAMAIYLPTFLLATYGVALSALAVALALIALGNLAGNLLGGWLADRITARPLAFAAASAATGALALPLMLWRPGLGASIALGFAYSLANAAGRPALMAALAEVPADVRGTVLGLNISVSSIGWLGAAALGGWLIEARGFAGLGAYGAALAVAGAGSGVLAWRLRRR